MRAEPVYRQILLVDVAGSSQLTDVEKPQVRTSMYGLLAVAFARVGLRWDTSPREDRGDGIFLLISPEVPKPVLAGDLVAAIDGILAGPRPGGGAWPRLRLCLHAGEVTMDAEGCSGRDVDHAFALVDSDAARQALRSHPEARCVLVVSDPYHEALAHGGADTPWAAGFTAVVVPAKLAARTAWIRVPCRPPGGGTAPPGWEPGGAATPGRVLVGLPSGLVSGPGLLVTERHVLTCAHLVPHGPTGPCGVAVTFGSVPWQVSRLAEVATWTDTPGGVPLVDAGLPAGSGLAVLALADGPPAGVTRAPLADLGPPTPGRSLVVPGSPPRVLEVIGSVGGSGALVRLRCPEGSDGRSGCAPGEPVVDGSSGAVVGMLLAWTGWPARDQVVMLRVGAAAPLWTGATRGDETTRPARRVTVLEFARAVAALQSMETGTRRNEVVNTLRPEVGAVAPRHSSRGHDVLSVVRTCLRYEGGVDELVAVLHAFEGDSTQMAVVLSMLGQLER